MLRRSASRITGTMSPASVADAMPMWKRLWTTISCVASSNAAFSVGWRFSAATTAFTKKGKNVSFTPCASPIGFKRFRSA